MTLAMRVRAVIQPSKGTSDPMGAMHPSIALHASNGSRHGYQRHEPEKTVLYKIVSEHLETFLEEVRDHYDKPLPKYVEKELRDYLRCGPFYAWIGVMRGRASRSAQRSGSTLHRACIIPGNVLRRVQVLLPRVAKGDPTDCYNPSLETALPH
jgi:hypothetical protein